MRGVDADGSGRGATRAGRGAGIARKLLSEAEVRAGLALTAEDIRVLRRCCSIRPPRNAVAIVNAIKMRAEYTLTKPAQKVDATLEGGSRPISISINGIVR